jgi:hypothetical protein
MEINFSDLPLTSFEDTENIITYDQDGNVVNVLFSVFLRDIIGRIVFLVSGLKDNYEYGTNSIYSDFSYSLDTIILDNNIIESLVEGVFYFEVTETILSEQGFSVILNNTPIEVEKLTGINELKEGFYFIYFNRKNYKNTVKLTENLFYLSSNLFKGLLEKPRISLNLDRIGLNISMYFNNSITDYPEGGRTKYSSNYTYESVRKNLIRDIFVKKPIEFKCNLIIPILKQFYQKSLLKTQKLEKQPHYGKKMIQ